MPVLAWALFDLARTPVARLGLLSGHSRSVQALSVKKARGFQPRFRCLGHASRADHMHVFRIRAVFCPALCLHYLCSYLCPWFQVCCELRTALKVRASLWKRHRLIGVLGKAGGPSHADSRRLVAIMLHLFDKAEAKRLFGSPPPSPVLCVLSGAGRRP